MLHHLKPAAWIVFILVCFTGLAGIAWQTNPATTNNTYNRKDTIPTEEKAKDNQTVINGDLDKALDEVNRAKENLDKQLQNKDWEKIHRDLELSLEKLNTENIHEQVEKALKNIDLQKIKIETDAALKRIDWDSMQKDLQKAQAELKDKLDNGKMQKELQKALEETRRTLTDQMSSIDMKKIQLDPEKTLQELKMTEGKIQEDLKKAKKAIQKNLSRNFEKELEKAKEGINKATEELQGYKEMLNEMDKDGLLHAAGPYDVKYKNGTLFIDGKQQPATITNKYKHYFTQQNVRIKKGKDGDDDKTIYL